MSESVYQIEFRKLQGCPALGKLWLYMRTSEGQIFWRLISESDLFVLSSNESRERIVAPVLKYVSMNGCWVIGVPLVLEQVLGGLFLRLEQLSAIGWELGGFSVKSFMRTTRGTGGRIGNIGRRVKCLRQYGNEASPVQGDSRWVDRLSQSSSEWFDGYHCCLIHECS
ncbi:MAG: hypothetical protein J3R72DRAFT_14514 [Linnemannia gamsii]|nr:MAG: hypothetical protein J3R72DRAFT_14514 [Linnemannia gamsii]